MELGVDRERVKNAFAKYVQAYDAHDEKIKLKIEHTARVAQLCDRIARSIALSETETDLAWLLGMLHDIGRFEQIRRFGTFVDAESIDHAHFGVQLLFDEGLLADYVDCPASSEEYEIIRTAIWNHSAFRPDESLTARQRMFCDILRDADKIDILKVTQETPISVLYNVSEETLRQERITDEVLQQFLERHAVLRNTKRTGVDHIVSYAALVFELVYPESVRITQEQGYLEKILSFASDCRETQERFEQMRDCMRGYMEREKYQKEARSTIVMEQEKVIVIDFGGQYNQLVARRVRECNVYCEIYSYRTDLETIKAMKPKGIILTGGPNSCYEQDSPTYQRELFELGIPVLGLCYGAQLMMHILGGKVEKAPVREYGKTEVFVDTKSPLFAGVSEKTICWMSHFDYISKIADGFQVVAHTADCPVAAAQDVEKKLFAIQFHPEVLHTKEGTHMLHNFVRGLCGCAGTWRMDSFVESSIAAIREKVGDGKVLCALSGGVDSSVAAVMLAKAIGSQLTCVFVDHGLLRKNEGDEVAEVFGDNGPYHLNFVRVNAQERFYEKLAGVTEPEKKRKIIGEEFIRVFEEEAKKIGKVDFLVQGTIYPDVVESGLGGESAVIKSHHNVGGLPDYVDFQEIIEPLRNLFKDEVRKAGLEMGLPKKLVFRQPFPGPGLGIRIIGDVTADKVRIVQDADAIYREEVDNAADAYAAQHGEPAPWKPDQYFAALTNMRSVGVMGDERTYDYAVALRAVNTIDFMTAESAAVPWEVLQKVMSRIINEVRGVNRVFYDLTSKPPGTIEFE